MATIRELVVSLGFVADATPLKKMDDGIEDLKKSFLALSAVAVSAAAAIFGIAKSTANVADEIRDTSIAAGISYDALQKLGYAAQLSGSNQQELGDSLRFLARASVEAKDANSEAAKSFHSLGISATDSSGKLKSPEELLLLLSDGFKKLPSGVEKSALAMQFFGRTGSKMVQFLNNGREGLGALGQEAESLGIIMNDSAIEAGAAFNDSLDSLLATMKGVMNAIGSGLIPVLQNIALDLREWIKANRELIKSRLKTFVEILTKYLNQFWRVIKAVYFVIYGLITVINKLTKSFGGFIAVLKTVGALIALYFLGKMAASVLNVAKGFLILGKAAIFAWKRVLLAPILIGAAIAGIFLIVEDFIAWLDGRPSVLGFILKNKDKILQSINMFFKKFTDKIAELLGVNKDVFNLWSKMIIGAIGLVTAFFVGKKLFLWISAFSKLTKAAMLFGQTMLSVGAKSAIAWVTAFWPIGLAIVAIAALGYAVSQVITYWDGLSESFRYLFDLFVEMLEGIWNKIKLGASAAWAFVQNVFISVIDNIKAAWSGITDFFSSLWQSILDLTISVGIRLRDAIVTPLKDAFNFVQDFVKSKFGFIAEKLGINLNAVDEQNPIQSAQAITSAPFGNITPATTTSNINNNSGVSNEIQSVINVTVPAGSDGAAIGEATSKALREEFSKILRPASRATKPAVAY